MISDFGLSKTEEDDSMMATACGTPGYVGRFSTILMSFMLLQRCQISTKGCLLKEMGFDNGEGGERNTLCLLHHCCPWDSKITFKQ